MSQPGKKVKQMKSIEISGQLRKETGKSETRKLRKSENVPCVLYGGEEVIHFYAHKNSFRDIVYTSDVFLITFDIEGKRIRATLKDIQFHPVTDEILHIDFIEVIDNKPITINIPVRLSGVSPGVKGGGKLRFRTRSLKIKGIADSIPECINVDISNLHIGDSVKVEDLDLEGLNILSPQTLLIVKVVTARGIQADEEEEEEEGEEGDTGEGEGQEASEEKSDE